MKEEIKSRVEDIKSKLRAQNQLWQEANDSLQKANERLNETKESIKNDLQSEYRNREHFSVLSPLKEQGERSGVKTPYELIKNERERKAEKYGYDDTAIIERVEDYGRGELALAAACFCDPSLIHMKDYFPWDKCYFKPSPNDRIKELVKAGAFIVDEIIRLQRLTNTSHDQF